MTTWPIPKALFGQSLTDAITGPTTLGILKEGLKEGKPLEELLLKMPDYIQDFFGFQGGSLGEVSAVALLIGAAYLFYRRIITWHIPVAYLGSAVVFTGILWLIDPTVYVDPLFHILAGGMLLGVFFMATDMVSSPMSSVAMLIYGAGCGIITILIRVWGAYPEGVSFAILIMNAFVPLLNQYIKPKRFGTIKVAA
jgi:electron transport complex protein RnfD